MLTTDLVRARRRQDRLHLIPLEGKAREEAYEIARVLVSATKELVGSTREEFQEMCAGISAETRDRRVGLGLCKLVEDQCEFEVASDTDLAQIRQEIFLAAASLRKTAKERGTWNRASVFEEVSGRLGHTPEALSQMLYGDLRSAHKLTCFHAITPEHLMHMYDFAQAQAVLLRAVRVVVEVQSSSSESYRHLFRALKFRRLMFRVEPLGHAKDGYSIELDGPYSLLSSVTKYGLQLALMLPALDACDQWRLAAEVRWGKQRTPLSFYLEGKGTSANHHSLHSTSEEITTLLSRFESEQNSWRASVCNEIIHQPGIGVCIPDLIFENTTSKERIYFELLGYWNRDTVWKRVELIERGFPHPIIFAVPERLRVSEEVLPDHLPAALHVFKTTINPRSLEQKLNQVLAR